MVAVDAVYFRFGDDRTSVFPADNDPVSAECVGVVPVEDDFGCSICSEPHDDSARFVLFVADDVNVFC